jgi:hypothetical protein
MASRSLHVVVMVGAGLMAGACQPPPQPDQNRAELEGLRPAHDCSATLPTFGRFPGGPREVIYIPPNGSISMANDGGWCWIQTEAIWERQLYTAPLQVTQPPTHGSVVVGSFGGQFRIAYQPAPRYLGSDAFHVELGGPTPWDIPVRVSVAQ